MATGEAHHGHHKIKLVIFPGERKNGVGTTVGHIYVIGGKGESYDMAGGPPPGKGSTGPGGHSAGVTPAGQYVLGRQEHHTTQNWPMSVIPWGATLREHGGEIQYQIGSHWLDATGTHGKVTQAAVLWVKRSGSQLPFAQIVKEVRALPQFRLPGGSLKSSWDLNDFGKWSWNLLKNGGRSAYYIHTTPDDESATATHKTFLLSQSHGCIHIRPSDRDDMTSKGYLKAGVEVQVKPYGIKGPP
ncbi:MAG: hypothetical protein P4L85_03550 [Paludisphaera borealis]|uniref:L,D-transpeptidase family protein n=1 Tax=Paludisphaera borealis TaxID=1387353 RepID=UPI002850770D|nr:L,D-transpeptidase family protein [Paludisphaera borealis]MDR3618401.1 hypothetical protein [Paludisphaera borealis]